MAKTKSTIELPFNRVTKSFYLQMLWKLVEKANLMPSEIDMACMMIRRLPLKDLKIARFENMYDFTLLMTAASRGHMVIVRALAFAGIPLNTKCKFNTTAIMEAAYLGHVDTVKFLIGAGAQLNIKDNNGHTALRKAREQKHKEIEDMLLLFGAHE